MKTKIVIAPDKFNGSLSGTDFCDIVERVFFDYLPDIEIYKVPLADGGDGTVDVVRYYTAGEQIIVPVNDPIMRKIEAAYLFSRSKNMAFIEMSATSGIRLLQKQELNPLETNTFGTGELIRDALSKGAKHIVLGIGGSATNDAGMGMARVLGFRFLDRKGKELKGNGAELLKLHSIDASGADFLLHDVKFEVACDVDNPLFGQNGAAYVYAPQKGADAEAVDLLDKGLKNFNSVVLRQFGVNLQKIPGTGAAGGLGAGCILFLNAQLKSGIELIKNIAGFQKKIQNAQWIITGEGKIDQQTFSGKVIKGILDSRTNQKIAVFCGKSELSDDMFVKHKIDYVGEILPLAIDVQDSIDNSALYLKRRVEEFVQSMV